MASVLDAFVRFIGDTKQLEKDLGPNGAVAGAANAGGAGAGQTFGQRFGNAAKTAIVGASAAGGVVFVGAIEKGVVFEDQLRTINTVAQLTDEELAKVGDGIQELSRETGKTTDDLAAGYYDLVSAGIDADAALGVLRDSAILGTGALGSTAEAVDLVTSVLNAYGLEADASTRVTDIFAKAVADGKVTAAELGASIANIAPVANAAGISIEEVSSGFAFLTAKGTPAAQAATQMRAAISALLTPNEALNRIQAQTGVNFAKLAKEKGLAVALDELRKHTEGTGGEFENLTAALAKADLEVQSGKENVGIYGDVVREFQDNLGLTDKEADKFIAAIGNKGMGEALAELGKKLGASDQGFAGALGSIEAYQFALNSTGEEAEAFAAQIEETEQASGIAQQQYEEKSKSAAEQGKRLNAVIDTFIQDIGGPFVGVLGPAVSVLGNLGTGMLGLMPIAKGLGGVIGGLGGLIATKVVPSLIAGFGGILPAITPILSTIGAAIPTLITAAMAAWPLLLVAAIVAGIIFLINNPEIVNNIATFAGEFLTNLLNFLGALPGMLADFFAGIFANLGPQFLQFAIDAALFILTIPFRILDLQIQLLEFFAGIATNLLGLIGDLIGNIVKFFFELPGKLVALGGEIVNTIIRGMADLPGKLFNTVANAFRNLRIDIGPFHISASGVSIDLPNIQLPSFAVGSNFIPADMLAMVHKGEIIVPADEAEAIRSGRATLGSASAMAGPAPESGGGGDVHVHFQGALPTRTFSDVTTGMRRLQDAGILVPKRTAPLFPTPLAKEG